MRRMLNLPVRHPLIIVLGTLLITVFLASQIVDFRTGDVLIELDPSIDRLLPDAGTERQHLARARLQFGQGEAVLLALHFGDVFEAEHLRVLQHVTEAVQEIEGVRFARSLANAFDTHHEESYLVVRRFLNVVPENPDEMERLRASVMGNPIVRGNLISEDMSTAAIVIYLREPSDEALSAQGIDQQIRAVVANIPHDAEIWLTGAPIIRAVTGRAMIADLLRILPLAFGILCAVSLVAFRSWRCALVPLLTVSIALVWVIGLVTWMGIPLNLVTVIIPPLLISVGFAYIIYIISDCCDRLENGDGESPVLAALQSTALPVFLAGLTTIVGFLSLAISRFPAVREFGLIASLGIGLTVLLSLSFGAALLQWLGPPKGAERKADSTGRSDFSFRLASRLGAFDVERRRIILVAYIGIGVAALAFASQIRVNTDVITNFPQAHQVRRDFDAISAKLQGGMPFSIVIESSEEDAFVQPENLAILEALQSWLSTQPEIGGSTSLVDYVKVTRQAFEGGGPASLAIPDNAPMVKQLLLIGATEEVSNYTDGPYRTVCIQVRAKTSNTESLSRLISRIDERLGRLPEGMSGYPTGETILLARAIDDVSRGQLRSLSIAFGFIFLLLAGLFTSFRAGALALLPNALPVLLYFGVLGITGIPLDLTTSLVACIILGIAVDDTIHFITRFNVEARGLVDERQGARRALLAVIKPITVTTAALCLGFLALTFSELQNQVLFGALGAFTLAFAWLADLTFTPALCSGLHIITLWDILSIDLGEHPQDSIPVFSGLSDHQARIVALSTNVVHFPAGEEIMCRGDCAREFFVVIDGELLISIDEGGEHIELSRARRGDTVGEVGLYYGRQTADVCTLSEVRLLRLTTQNLTRLASRFPRTGAHVSMNLSKILAARVAHLTARGSRAFLESAATPTKLLETRESGAHDSTYDQHIQ